MLSKIVGALSQPTTFDQRYSSEVTASARSLLESGWTSAGKLWGDFRCKDTEHCGIILRSQILSRCPRCFGPIHYLRRELKSDTGIEARPDGVLFLEPLRGYVVYKVATKNAKVITEAKRSGSLPYQSDVYGTAFAASLLEKELPVVGRLILWLSKSSPLPFHYWYLDGVGKNLFLEQEILLKETSARVSSGDLLSVKGRCRTVVDAKGCKYAPFCLDGMYESLITRTRCK